MEKSNEFKPWHVILIIGLILVILFLLLRPKKDTRIGGTGTPITVSDSAAFVQAVKGSTSRVIQVLGKFNIGYCMVGSNLTIVGVGTNATVVGTLRIENSKNVLVQYLNCTTPKEGTTWDAIAIATSSDVLIDHCNIYDWRDGGCDITKQSTNVEVRWCHFWFTYAWEHPLAMLIGSDPNAPDAGYLKVKVHHNFFDRGIWDRYPFGRLGEIAVWNNVYRGTSSYNPQASYITAAQNVKFYSRNNVFIDGEDPYIKKESGGQINAAGDLFYPAVTKVVIYTDASFTPNYELTDLMTAAVAESKVMNGAGVVVAEPPPSGGGGDGGGGNADTTVTCKYDTVITRHCDTMIVIKPAPEPGPDKVEFALIDAVTEQALFNIQEGQVIKLTGLANLKLNMRAITPNDITKVKFVLSGKQSKNYTDGASPFALHGDDGNGNYYYGNWNPPAIGLYKLVVTPYKGTVAQPDVVVNFSFAN